MKPISNNTIQVFKRPSREIKGRIDNLSASLFFSWNDCLKSFTIQNETPTSRFFGFGFGSVLKTELIDKNRDININKGHILKPQIGTFSNYQPEHYAIVGQAISGLSIVGVSTPKSGIWFPYQKFTVTDIERNENTNVLTITAYDALGAATEHSIDEVDIEAPYTIRELVEAVGDFLGVRCITTDSTLWDLSYEQGGNFSGKETLRSVLDSIAEVTGTVYFIDWRDHLVFKNPNSEPVDFSITKSDYFTLTSGDSRRLVSIASVTELGDNIRASLQEDGEEQLLRENPFLNNNDNTPNILQQLINEVGLTSMVEYNIKWRGCPALEPMDKFAITAKDGSVFYTYSMNPGITYNGGLSFTDEFVYNDEEQVEAAPASLGDIIKGTYARVDKVNNRIDLVASETDANREQIAQLTVQSDSIVASVSAMESSVSSLNGEVQEAKQMASLAITPQAVDIKISEAINNGVHSVETETGFRFDNQGLTISNSDDQMSTNVNSDGLVIYKDGTDEQLKVDNSGVSARNLKANYIIISGLCRFEAFGTDRVGLFWL